MKHWTAESVFADGAAPAAIGQITTDVLAAFDGIAVGGFPRLVSVAQREDEDLDYHRYEVLVELAPGVVLPTEYGTIEGIADGNEEEDDEDQVAGWVMEGVLVCRQQLGRLSDILHDTRVRVRKSIGEWGRSGVHARLVDVLLAPYDHWRGEAEPRVRVLIEALDDRLQPTVNEIGWSDAEELRKELDYCREGIMAMSAARAELASQGASGWVSQLALNAMAHFGDTAETLRRFADEERFWLPDDTCLAIRAGSVDAGTGLDDGPIHWAGDRVTIDGDSLPETVLVSAIGKPITDVFQHPFVSDDMTIIDASSLSEEGRNGATFRLAMPRRLFCSVTGRVWDPAQHATRAEPDERSNVVSLVHRTR